MCVYMQMLLYLRSVSPLYIVIAVMRYGYCCIAASNVHFALSLSAEPVFMLIRNTER